MKRHRDGYMLSTGQSFYANLGLLSLDDDGELHEGYDGTVTLGLDDSGSLVRFTPDERREIADYMIQRWRAWGDLP